MELYPLSKPQMSIWNMEQYYGGGIAGITVSAMLSGAADANALHAALNNTLEQNDSLRIRIKTQNGTPMQYIAAFSEHIFEAVSFTSKEDFETWAKTLACTPFDLSGDLFEFYIVTVDKRIGFVLHMHHLTADAWTLNLLVSSVLKNLKGEHVGKNSYIDYIAAQQEYENSARREKDKAYFLSGFEKCDEPVYLSDRQAKSAESRRFSQRVNVADSTAINSFCSCNSISPYAFFMSALAIYIYRIKGAHDFYIGTSVLNRTGRREKETAGIYINTVPVLFHIDEAKSSIEVITDNAESIMGVFRHQKYQYGDLLKDVREKHNFTGRLYDVTLNYQNVVLADGIKSSDWHFCGSQGESLNIHINDRQSSGEYHLDYDFQDDLFTGREIERLHGHLLTLIFDIIKNPSKKPQDLKLLTDGDYKQVVYDFNDTAIDYPKGRCIHQLFEEQAAKTPDAVAVVFEDMEYTYLQINDMANSLAHVLQDKGVGRNDIVAIIAKRSYKIIVAQLAVLKAGGAFLPIEPTYPKDRIAFMLEDSKCKTALVLGTAIADIDSIDMADDKIFTCNADAVENINSPEDLCYVMYTSGSTGAPKGAMIAHRNLGNFCSNNNSNNMQKAVFSYCKSVLAIGAMIFDISIFEIFLSLAYGKRIIYTNESQMNDSDALVKLIIQWEVDCIHITPTKLNWFTQDNRFKTAIKQVKVFMIGGESLSKDLVEVVRQNSKAHIFNGYGPTETTLGVSFGKIVDSDITIGKPIANTQIYILDKHLCPLPIGAAGELCIAGDGVGLGYLNRPELTFEKFVDNPFGSGKMYKTGDLAKWRSDGNIEYIGRMDNQVKIRGLRVELGEIEAAIGQYEGIKQIAVVIKTGDGGRQFICAYYVGDGVDIAKLKAMLSAKLPQYMIPHFFIQMERFPTTASGKTDRNALPLPDFSKIQSSQAYAPPVTDEEKALTALMEQVLNVERVGLDDNFFDLGGDSLKVIEFVSKAHYESFSFSLQDVFDNPTAALLLACIEGGGCQSVQYDAEVFEAIHRMLESNRIIKSGTAASGVINPLGDALITGATGWLGVHILDEFLSHESGRAYCLVRGCDFAESQKRLEGALEFYFGDKYANCGRIIAVCGDITGSIVIPYPIDTVFHCAANVKHYGSYRHFHDVNVTGTKNVIVLAKEKGAKLIHISTASVSGNSFDHSADFPPAVFDETKLYIGQALKNVYIRSKFESEAEVLKARLEGLDAAVIRVGNLSNRRSDLRFQKNHHENATLMRLKAFINLGMFPRAMAWFPLELSPVDDTAMAVVKLAQHMDERHSVYHAYNHNTFRFKAFVKAARAAGIEMKPVTAKRFLQHVRDAGRDPERAHIHEALINDIGEDGKVKFFGGIKLKCDFTARHLKQAGVGWRRIDDSYLTGYVNYFQNIKYWGVEA